MLQLIFSVHHAPQTNEAGSRTNLPWLRRRITYTFSNHTSYNIPSCPFSFTFYRAIAARIAAPTIPAPTWTVFPELLDCVAAAAAEVALPDPDAAGDAPVVVAPVAVAPEEAELAPDAADPVDPMDDMDEATDEPAEDAWVEAGVDAPLLPPAVARAQIWLVISVVAITIPVSSNAPSAHSSNIGCKKLALTQGILCRATALDAPSTLGENGVVAGCALAYIVSESTA